MKIKVKRYKEIEKIAIVEATQRILGEEMDLNKIQAAAAAIRASGLEEASIAEILNAIRRVAEVDLGLVGE